MCVNKLRVKNHDAEIYAYMISNQLKELKFKILKLEVFVIRNYKFKMQIRLCKFELKMNKYNI